MIKCVDCGREIDSVGSCCPYCGCPIEYQDVNNPKEVVTMLSPNLSSPKKNPLKAMRKGLVLTALICFIISGLFFAKGHDVKTNYYNSENYPSLNENAYVGGDAYNYIINGTYFTAYSVIASASLLCGAIFTNSAINITMRLHEEK